MAVIGRIRKRVGLVIAFVGISMLLFILGDLVTSNTGLMNRNSDVVGEIGGNKIRYSEFEKRVETLTENYKLNTRQETVDQNTTDMLREQAWSLFTNELTLGEEYKKLGISCSPEELYDMCTGKTPNAQVAQAFTDPKTQQFDPNAVVKFLKDLPNREENIQRQWKNFEDAISEERIAEKYRSLIKGGLYVTTAEAKRNYEETNRMAALRFARLDFNTIPDSSAKVEDSDLQAYYNANQSRYKQAETIRKVEYVAFDVTPSGEDRQAAMEWISKKKEELAVATDVPMFVNQNSDTPFDSTYHAKGSLKPAVDTIAFTATPGTIIGPYEEFNSLKVSRVMGDKFVADSVKARHILIKADNGDTAKARATADSLKNAIQKGASFADLATKFSQDPGSAVKGGDLGWFRQGVMVPSFNDACFNGKKGDMPIVSSQFGVHLIEIMDKGAPSRQVQIATIERKIEPSQRTYDDFFNRASQFAASCTSPELFDSLIIKQSMAKRIADNIRESDKNVPGLDQPRELVRWAYGANKGDISKVFTFGDKYVVAKLANIKNKGILPLEEVKEAVTAEARKQKKAEMLVAKFEGAKAGSIDEIAAKLNITATDAENVNFVNGYVPGMGNEPKVVGAVFAMKQGQLSGPLTGETGVCVVFVKGFTEPGPTTDYSAQAKSLAEQRRSRSDYEVGAALKEKVGVEDNRGRFY